MRPAADHPLQLVAGLVVWTVWFVVVYGGQALACAVAPPEPLDGVANPVSGVLLAISAATCAGLVAAALLCARAARRREPGTPRFVAAASAALHAVAAISTAVVALPLLAVPPCV